MNLHSEAFADGEPIPHDYTADGNGHSPPLHFSDVPRAARSLVLMMDDCDVPDGPMCHWILFNIPPAVTGLARAEMPGKYRDGANAFGRMGYSGPKSTKHHHYVFRLYALSAILDLPNGIGRWKLKREMEGRVLAEAQLMGSYMCRAPLPDRSATAV